jgi:hypothetical protein
MQASNANEREDAKLAMNAPPVVSPQAGCRVWS